MNAHEFLVDLLDRMRHLPPEEPVPLEDRRRFAELMIAEAVQEPTPEEWDARMEEIARRAEGMS